MKRLALGLLAAVALAACTPNKDQSMAALEQYGYTDVHLGGYPLLDACGKSYTFKRAFKATNQAGRHVSGVICRGWIKGTTVKLT